MTLLGAYSTHACESAKTLSQIKPSETREGSGPGSRAPFYPRVLERAETFEMSGGDIIVRYDPETFEPLDIETWRGNDVFHLYLDDALDYLEVMRLAAEEEAGKIICTSCSAVNEPTRIACIECDVVLPQRKTR